MHPRIHHVRTKLRDNCIHYYCYQLNGGHFSSSWLNKTVWINVFHFLLYQFTSNERNCSLFSIHFVVSWVFFLKFAWGIHPSLGCNGKIGRWIMLRCWIISLEQMHAIWENIYLILALTWRNWIPVNQSTSERSNINIVFTPQQFIQRFTNKHKQHFNSISVCTQKVKERERERSQSMHFAASIPFQRFLHHPRWFGVSLGSKRRVPVWFWYSLQRFFFHTHPTRTWAPFFFFVCWIFSVSSSTKT